MMDNTAEYTDPQATVTWNPPLYPDTVDMTTGRDLMGELAQLQTELQVKCMELAALEDERAVTVDLLRIARESRRRLVGYIRGEGGGHDTDTAKTTA